MLLRLSQDRVGRDRHDLALVVDRAKLVASAFDLMQEADRLRRVALEVQFEHDGGVLEAAQRLLHPFPDQAFRTLCVDLDQVQTWPGENCRLPFNRPVYLSTDKKRRRKAAIRCSLGDAPFDSSRDDKSINAWLSVDQQ
jgi:hypothetical protein